MNGMRHDILVWDLVDRFRGFIMNEEMSRETADVTFFMGSWNDFVFQGRFAC